MLREKRGSVEWLEFELFQEIPQMKHAVFTRHGGVSKGPYASLNAGGGSGDEEANIQMNREKMRKVLGCKTLISSKQVHGVEILEVPLQPDREECDGLIIQKHNIGLMIKHADCQALIFYDSVEKALGCLHAGWKGNVQNIYEKMIQKMTKEFGSKPANLLVGISPSLGPCCAQFTNYEKEIPEHYWIYQVRPFYFDLWEMARVQLLQAGVLSHHLEIAPLCTYCNPADFYSYRRDKPTGRHATVACLV